MMTSTMTNEPRVRREAGTLSDLGAEVIALGIRADGSEPRRESIDGLDVRRIELLDMRIVRLVRRILDRLAEMSASSPPAELAPMTAAPAADRIQRRRDLAGDVRNLVHWLAAFVSFLWHARRLHADVLHPHDIPPLAAGLVLTRGRARLAYESHEYWAEKFPTQPLSRRLAMRIERIACRRADLTIVVNDSIGERMAADHGTDQALTILNVSDIRSVDTIEVAPEDGPLQVLYHGIVVPGRGVELLVDALARMKEPAELTVRGSGDALEASIEKASSLGVADRVTFVPPVPLEDVVSAASRSHVGVMPFENRLGYELALPNKLFEYLAAGLAVVASDLPELRRIIDGEKVGQVVPSGDADALARALDRIAVDRDLLAAQRNRALSAAKRLYAWPVHQVVLSDAYAPLLCAEEK
jgi:glycogen(starch) synthase